MSETRSPGSARPRPTALQYAVRLLSARGYSERKLREKLRNRDYSRDEIDEAIAKLIARRLLDDRAYAEDFVRSRCASQPRGRSALIRDLISRGIPASLAGEVVGDAVSDADEMELARELVARKAAQYRSLDAETQRRRLSGLLARRGFRPQTIHRVVSDELNDSMED